MNVSMKKQVIAGIVGLALGTLSVTGCKDANAAEANSSSNAQRAPEVEVVKIALQNLDWTETYPARVEGARVVQVRPRVSGIIVKRSYTEGSTVNEGDVLFQIDPVPFELALEQAKAKMEVAKAQEMQASRDWTRVAALYGSGSLSEKQRDDALSARDLAKANLMGAEAALRQAEVNLGYTKVTAPVSGTTSLEVFNEGSLVSSADILTTVTQQNPVHVLFSLPEGDPAYELLFANGSRHKEGSTALTLFTRSGDRYGRLGQVNFTETAVDPKTASIRVRAVFDNPDGELLSGQFARVAFDGLKLPPCAVIPEASVIVTAQGAIVYTVGNDNTVAPRPVKLGPVLDEGQLVTAGLNDGDRVIITSLIRIKPGQQVVAKEKGQTVEAAQ